MSLKAESDRQPDQRSTLLPRLLLYLKGVAMGIGDSVPGISGGTIAVITNIYDTLIYSIRAVDLQALSLLRQLRIAELWRHVNGNFLLLLGAGIVSGLLGSARTVLYLLDNHFEPLMALFIGLVLASTWLLRDNLSLRRRSRLAALLMGIVLTVAVASLDPVAVASSSHFYVFVCGAVAISAMILPGLSGAFILLLLGMYEFMLSALVEWRWDYIFVFILGAGLGLMAFSRLLAWLLHQYHQLSYSFITGMLLGSLPALWPWRQVLEFTVDSDGNQQALKSVNVWPLNYSEITGNAPHLGLALLACVGGALVVVLLHRVFADRNSASTDKSR